MMLLGTLLLTVTWCVLTREWTVSNVLLGGVLGALLQLAVRGAAGATRRRGPKAAIVRLWAAIELGLFFLYELVVASARLAWIVVRPRLELRTAIVAVRVETESEAELATLANLVTLTPGTLSLDVSEDGRTLYVHVMGAEDPEEVRREIEEGFARRVRRVFA